ncbi:hypothetical protein [Cytobacillus oceanisediminis]|uniref:hypothetical protein n=1 Tax=Cytobacillus oceanisediminis TaxID=665099 RepID=UPI001C22BB0C|nr:hypothetical protein [Cytobacillus oceanisediminis]MBU8770348.1 hypothetical protein [Cytobacillus oceanisediminis]
MEGILFVGVTGFTLVMLHVLEQSGFPINTAMIRLFMEVSKYGAILWLLKVLSKTFF